MLKFENLLRNEYFPRELPPCFNTQVFANNHEAIKKIVERVESQPSEPVVFSGFKNANSRRKFAIPNPIYYAKLASILVDNNEQLEQLFKCNNSSLTVPIKGNLKRDESYSKRTKNIFESKEAIKKIYMDNMVEIKLDIQSFFDSIYTHSIPWAIHGKAFSKKNRDMKHFGNKLDLHIRNMNSQQTNGILVGNALSRIISEIILCAVDREISPKIENCNYLRFVDDYYIYTKDMTMVPEIISIFRQQLSKFELTLNGTKIEINESPFIYGKPWVEQMRAHTQLNSNIFLEKSIIEFKNYKDIYILKYAFQVIRSVKFSKKEWDMVQPIIFNIWVRFPSLSELVTLIFKNNEALLDKKLLKNAIYTIIDTNIYLGYDEEVIWAVWMCKAFELDLNESFTKRIMASDNWLAIVVLLDYKCQHNYVHF